MNADLFLFTDFLACDIGIYLMPYDSTIYFLKELLGGRKSMIKTT